MIRPSCSYFVDTYRPILTYVRTRPSHTLDYPSHDSRAIEAEKQIERERAAFAEQQIIAEQEMVGLVFGDNDREVISVVILWHSMGMPSISANPRPNPLVPSVQTNSGDAGKGAA